MSKSTKRTKAEDSVGKKFGKLLVVSVIPNQGSKAKLNCICECGRETETLLSNLLYQGTSRCRKCSYERCAKKHEGIYYELFYRFSQNALKRDIEFSISIEEAWELYNAQKGKCAFTGEDLFLGETRNDYRRTASLDRIDSSKGYFIGNVQWVHKDINFMKQELSDDRFIDWCIRVAKHRGKEVFNG